MFPGGRWPISCLHPPHPVISFARLPLNQALIRIGSLLAGGGVAWATWTATSGIDVNDFMQDGFRRIFAQSGPMEICALGVVIWLLGKWRQHTLLK